MSQEPFFLTLYNVALGKETKQTNKDHRNMFELQMPTLNGNIFNEKMCINDKEMTPGACHMCPAYKTEKGTIFFITKYKH